MAREIADVAAAGTIEASWGNNIRNRAIMRYASSSARDSAVPSPDEGEVCYLEDDNVITVYDGSAWQTYYADNVADIELDTVTLGSDEDLTSGTLTAWPTGLGVSTTVPDGVSKAHVVAVLPSIYAITATANHEIVLTINASDVASQRIRWASGTRGHIVLQWALSVTPGDAFAAEVKGRQVSGTGALRAIASENVNTFTVTFV